MHVRTILSLAVVAGSAACAAAKPHTYGAYNDYAPKVAPVQGERTPQHLTVTLNRASNVAILLVVPGGASRLLFPADSAQGSRIESGQHTVETSIARLALSDSSRLIRRPNGNTTPLPNNRQGNRNGRGGFDPNGNSVITRGYLLVYATNDSLSYSALTSKVAGVSVPIDDDDALNTVTKLLRDVTRTRGSWAAYATDFSP